MEQQIAELLRCQEEQLQQLQGLTERIESLERRVQRIDTRASAAATAVEGPLAAAHCMETFTLGTKLSGCRRSCSCCSSRCNSSSLAIGRCNPGMRRHQTGGPGLGRGGSSRRRHQIGSSRGGLGRRVRRFQLGDLPDPENWVTQVNQLPSAGAARYMERWAGLQR